MIYIKKNLKNGKTRRYYLENNCVGKLRVRQRERVLNIVSNKNEKKNLKKLLVFYRLNTIVELPVRYTKFQSFCFRTTVGKCRLWANRFVNY